MKTPRPKIHLIDVSEPLLGFHNLVMRCEHVLTQAEIIWMVRDDYATALPSEQAGQLCRKCIRDVVPYASSGRVYSYACIEGAEAQPSAEEQS
jgi:hypothetical protein